MEVLIRDCPIEITSLIFHELNSVLDVNVLLGNSIIFGSYLTHLLSRTIYYNGDIVDYDDIDILVNNPESLFLILSSLKPYQNIEIYQGSRYGCNTFNIVIINNNNHDSYKNHKLTLQFVMRNFSSYESILNSLDFDCCQFLLTSMSGIVQLIHTVHADVAMRTRVISYCRIIYEHRVHKMIGKNFKGIPLNAITIHQHDKQLERKATFGFLDNITFFNDPPMKQWYPITNFMISKLTVDPQIYHITNEVDQTIAILTHGLPSDLCRIGTKYQCYFKTYNGQDNIIRCTNTEFLLCLNFVNGILIKKTLQNYKVTLINPKNIILPDGYFGCYCNTFLINNQRHLIIKVNESTFKIGDITPSNGMSIPEVN